MQFLSAFVAILLGGFALAFVLYPLYQYLAQGSRSLQGGDSIQGGGKPRPYQTRNANSTRNMVGAGLAMENSSDESANSQAERELTARNALQEVELDFQLGNLSKTDYRFLRERYTRRALLAMKYRHDREQELDEAIEEQLRRMRETNEHAAD